MLVDIIFPYNDQYLKLGTGARDFQSVRYFSPWSTLLWSGL